MESGVMSTTTSLFCAFAICIYMGCQVQGDVVQEFSFGFENLYSPFYPDCDGEKNNGTFVLNFPISDEYPVVLLQFIEFDVKPCANAKVKIQDIDYCEDTVPTRVLFSTADIPISVKFEIKDGKCGTGFKLYYVFPEITTDKKYFIVGEESKIHIGIHGLPSQIGSTCKLNNTGEILSEISEEKAVTYPYEHGKLVSGPLKYNFSCVLYEKDTGMNFAVLKKFIQFEIEDNLNNSTFISQIKLPRIQSIALTVDYYTFKESFHFILKYPYKYPTHPCLIIHLDGKHYFKTIDYERHGLKDPGDRQSVQIKMFDTKQNTGFEAGRFSLFMYILNDVSIVQLPPVIFDLSRPITNLEFEVEDYVNPLPSTFPVSVNPGSTAPVGINVSIVDSNSLQYVVHNFIECNSQRTCRRGITSLFSVPPGKYTIKVTAKNAHGMRTASPKFIESFNLVHAMFATADRSAYVGKIVNFYIIYKPDVDFINLELFLSVDGLVLVNNNITMHQNWDPGKHTFQDIKLPLNPEGYKIFVAQKMFEEKGRYAIVARVSTTNHKVKLEQEFTLDVMKDARDLCLTGVKIYDYNFKNHLHTFIQVNKSFPLSADVKLHCLLTKDKAITYKWTIYKVKSLNELPKDSNKFENIRIEVNKNNLFVDQLTFTEPGLYIVKLNVLLVDSDGEILYHVFDYTALNLTKGFYLEARLCGAHKVVVAKEHHMFNCMDPSIWMIGMKTLCYLNKENFDNDPEYQEFTNTSCSRFSVAQTGTVSKKPLTFYLLAFEMDRFFVQAVAYSRHHDGAYYHKLHGSTFMEVEISKSVVPKLNIVCRANCEKEQKAHLPLIFQSDCETCYEFKWKISNVNSILKDCDSDRYCRILPETLRTLPKNYAVTLTVCNKNCLSSILDKIDLDEETKANITSDVLKASYFTIKESAKQFSDILLVSTKKPGRSLAPLLDGIIDVLTNIRKLLKDIYASYYTPLRFLSSFSQSLIRTSVNLMEAMEFVDKNETGRLFGKMSTMLDDTGFDLLDLADLFPEYDGIVFKNRIFEAHLSNLKRNDDTIFDRKDVKIVYDVDWSEFSHTDTVNLQVYRYHSSKAKFIGKGDNWQIKNDVTSFSLSKVERGYTVWQPAPEPILPMVKFYMHGGKKMSHLSTTINFNIVNATNDVHSVAANITLQKNIELVVLIDHVGLPDDVMLSMIVIKHNETFEEDDALEFPNLIITKKNFSDDSYTWRCQLNVTGNNTYELIITASVFLPEYQEDFVPDFVESVESLRHGSNGSDGFNISDSNSTNITTTMSPTMLTNLSTTMPTTTIATTTEETTTHGPTVAPNISYQFNLTLTMLASECSVWDDKLEDWNFDICESMPSSNPDELDWCECDLSKKYHWGYKNPRHLLASRLFAFTSTYIPEIEEVIYDTIANDTNITSVTNETFPTNATITEPTIAVTEEWDVPVEYDDPVVTYAEDFPMIPTPAPSKPTIKSSRQNPLAIGGMIAMIFVFVGILFSARQKDLKRAKTPFYIEVCDNVPYVTYRYLLTIYTGNRMNAAPSSTIVVKICGTDHQSIVHILQKHDDKEKHLCRGSAVTFLMTGLKNIGEITSVKIWQDGQGNNPQWYINRLVVRDFETSECWFFLANDWLNDEDPFEGPEELELYPSSMRDLFLQKHLFSIKFSSYIKERHLWYSLLANRLWYRNDVTQMQRVGCCFLYTAMTAVTSLILYNSYGTNDFLSLPNILVGLASGAACFPSTYLISTMFRSSKTRRIYGKDDDITATSLDELTQKYLSLKKSYENEQVVPKTKKSKTGQKKSKKSKKDKDNFFTAIVTSLTSLQASDDKKTSKKHKTAKKPRKKDKERYSVGGMSDGNRDSKLNEKEDGVEQQNLPEKKIEKKSKKSKKKEKASESDIESKDKTDKKDKEEPDSKVKRKKNKSKKDKPEPSGNPSVLSLAADKLLAIMAVDPGSIDSKPLPWVCQYIAWILIGLVGGGSCAGAVFYGMDLDNKSLLGWLISFSCGLLESIFIIETIKTVLLAYLDVVLNAQMDLSDWIPPLRAEVSLKEHEFPQERLREIVAERKQLQIYKGPVSRDDMS
uniref:uncharacterized protein LOC120341332 n=1 Tax=Styela clava TaxID=7725 RepID=UPI00193AA3CB|nr:uncharacterized protein LOC120341332 [Styela clava]